MGGVAAHLHVRAVALEVARQRVDVLAPAIAATLPVLVIVILIAVGSHLVALSNSRKISVTHLADRHCLVGPIPVKPSGFCLMGALSGFMKTETVVRRHFAPNSFRVRPGLCRNRTAIAA